MGKTRSKKNVTFLQNTPSYDPSQQNGSLAQEPEGKENSSLPQQAKGKENSSLPQLPLPQQGKGKEKISLPQQKELFGIPPESSSLAQQPEDKLNVVVQPDAVHADLGPLMVPELRTATTTNPAPVAFNGHTVVPGDKGGQIVQLIIRIVCFAVGSITTFVSFRFK